MIDRREILDTAETLGLLPHVVEKDYVPGWIPAGMHRQKTLAESWMFKGGTCLKTYRFSEDLNSTPTDPSQIESDFLPGMFRNTGEWVYDKTGIELPEELQEFDAFEPPQPSSAACRRRSASRAACPGSPAVMTRAISSGSMMSMSPNQLVRVSVDLPQPFGPATTMRVAMSADAERARRNSVRAD